jgi:hypothetical protein
MELNTNPTPEYQRLTQEDDRQAYWLKWGPYLSERQWGTVREDYSADGDAWRYITHDEARFRAYRWGEDGIAGISDTHQRLCFAPSFWNGNDPILKERLFGLSSWEGNHGEDVKECYFYLDNTPTHSYMKYLYKYPQSAFPYEELVKVNQERTKQLPEYEILDTKVFEKGYFDIFVEYAKRGPEDILIQITAHNRSNETAPLHIIPTLWFRNTWDWGLNKKNQTIKADTQGIKATHPELGNYWLYMEANPKILFTENETNNEKLFGTENKSPNTKDAFHQIIINNMDSLTTEGTKCGLHFQENVAPNGAWCIKLVLSNCSLERPFDSFESTITERIKEADQFYDKISNQELNPESKNIFRQSLSGMLWNKQWYHYVVERWLKGDPGQPPPPKSRWSIRNEDWMHVYSDDILSMPDKWEYPWFASWDSCFHTIALALICPEIGKRQLLRLTREWYMHPNGQIPAYEWNFSDVNPPVQAWAAWHVYKIEQKKWGVKDTLFLEKVFQKLLLNFTWWVNRKDIDGKNVFEGGFLGLDNISVFNRSKPLPTGGTLNQADGTSWMGMYCLNMLEIALELALTKPAYEDIASKFFEHFLYIANAISHIGESGISLWNEEDGFFYDIVRLPGGDHFPLKVHSLVGLVPLFAVMTLEPIYLEKLPGFRKRYEWFVKNRADLCDKVACLNIKGEGERRLLALVGEEKLKRILARMLNEREFLSPFGVRSLSAYHRDHPYILQADNETFRVDYEPAESTTSLFGGNSNWRGPIWFPMNYLLIDALKRFHHYSGDDFKVECPTGSNHFMTLDKVAQELSSRLINIYKTRAVNGRLPDWAKNDPHWKDYFWFYEYFHGDTGCGLGANHQTGWTGLIAKLIDDFAN